MLAMYPGSQPVGRHLEPTCSCIRGTCEKALNTVNYAIQFLHRNVAYSCIGVH